MRVKITGIVELDTELTTLSPNGKNVVDLDGDGGIGYSLQLVDLLPYPQVGKNPDVKEYTATFKLIVI